MSDFFPGPGWWMASDGKWYEPSTHPDPNYRASFADADAVEVEPEAVESEVILDLTEPTEEPVSSEEEEEAADAAQSLVGEPSEVSKAPKPESKSGARNTASVEAPEREKVASGSSGSTGWIADQSANTTTGFSSDDATEPLSAEERAEAVQAREMEERRVRLERARRSAEALRDRMAPLPEHEAQEQVDNAEVRPQHAHVASPLAGRTKLEIDGSAGASERHKPLHFAGPQVPTTTALVHVPGADKPDVDPIDRLLAVLLFLCGIAMVVGAFMEWTTGPTTEIGWERPDGIVVVAAGAIAAAAAGPLYGGLYAAWARGIAITAGVVGLMGVGVVTVTTLTEMELTGKTIGAGVYVVGSATLGAIVASLASSKHSH